MAQKQFTYKGKTLDELQKLSLDEFMKLIPSRQRRSLSRGFTDHEKKLLAKIKKVKEGKYKKIVKTHCRDIVILPNMVGLMIHIHNGREYVPIKIIEEMIGKVLGEFALTRKRVEHSAPGIGATRSSAGVSAK